MPSHASFVLSATSPIAPMIFWHDMCRSPSRMSRPSINASLGLEWRQGVSMPLTEPIAAFRTTLRCSTSSDSRSDAADDVEGAEGGPEVADGWEDARTHVAIRLAIDSSASRSPSAASCGRLVWIVVRLAVRVLRMEVVSFSGSSTIVADLMSSKYRSHFTFTDPAGSFFFASLLASPCPTILHESLRKVPLMMNVSFSLLSSTTGMTSVCFDTPAPAAISETSPADGWVPVFALMPVAFLPLLVDAVGIRSCWITTVPWHMYSAARLVIVTGALQSSSMVSESLARNMHFSCPC